MSAARGASRVDVLRPDWPAPPGVQAAFTLRTGGVSAAPYEALNLGAHVGDFPESVAENRRRVREHLGLPAEPAWLAQTHGRDVADLDGIDPTTGLREQGPAGVAVAAATADAALTRRPGRICAVLVADCLPVLFAARDGSAVAAAHAGWRGLAAGVLESTVAALETPGPALIAWLGPAIGQDHFEVGEEVRREFVGVDRETAVNFMPNARGRWQCDLAGLARRRLLALGITAVSGGNLCTYADAARFYSYRRDGRCGRMAALAWLN